MRRVALLLVAIAACADLKSGPGSTPADSGAPTTSSSGGDEGGVIPDATIDPGPEGGLLPFEEDAGVTPSGPCEPAPDECLDPTPENVVEVPTEKKSLADAIAGAHALDTIQLRGGVINGSVKIPGFVKLHGCQGAIIAGEVAFTGGGQTISGFTVTGSIRVTSAGAFSIHGNTFRKSFTALDENPGVSLSTILMQLGTKADVGVEECRFLGRAQGIELQASTDFGVTGLFKLSVTNTVFSKVDKPIVVMRTAPTSNVSVNIASSTFYDFGTAVLLNDVSATEETVKINTSLFVKGLIGVDARQGVGWYGFAYSFAHDLPVASASPPHTSTGITDAEPRFVDVEKDDLRLGPSSQLVNRVSPLVLVPDKDFNGCPRPAGGASDPGAFESQPP